MRQDPKGFKNLSGLKKNKNELNRFKIRSITTPESKNGWGSFKFRLSDMETMWWQGINFSIPPNPTFF
jgi:hypothetical protein